MITKPINTYIQTPSKIRVLWNIAKNLISDYENFDSRLSLLEKKADELSYKISLMADKIKNV